MHASTLDVTTSGLKRVVCESCGLVAIRPVTSIEGEINRSSFARRSEGGRRRAEPDRIAPRWDDAASEEWDSEGSREADGPGSHFTGSLGRI